MAPLVAPLPASTEMIARRCCWPPLLALHLVLLAPAAAASSKPRCVDVCGNASLCAPLPVSVAMIAWERSRAIYKCRPPTGVGPVGTYIASITAMIVHIFGNVPIEVPRHLTCLHRPWLARRRAPRRRRGRGLWLRGPGEPVERGLAAGADSPGRWSRSCTTLYISLVIVYVLKYTRAGAIDFTGHRRRREGKIHRVDPDFGSTLTASLLGILSQNAGSTGKLWVNPVYFRLGFFRFRPSRGARRRSWSARPTDGASGSSTPRSPTGME